MRGDVSPALEAVVLRALAKEPARRFADAEAMLSALADEHHAAALAIAAREDEATTEAIARAPFATAPDLEPAPVRQLAVERRDSSSRA